MGKYRIWYYDFYTDLLYMHDLDAKDGRDARAKAPKSVLKEYPHLLPEQVDVRYVAAAKDAPRVWWNNVASESAKYRALLHIHPGLYGLPDTTNKRPPIEYVEKAEKDCKKKWGELPAKYRAELNQLSYLKVR